MCIVHPCLLVQCRCMFIIHSCLLVQCQCMSIMHPCLLVECRCMPIMHPCLLVQVQALGWFYCILLMFSVNITGCSNPRTHQNMPAKLLWNFYTTRKISSTKGLHFNFILIWLAVRRAIKRDARALLKNLLVCRHPNMTAKSNYSTRDTLPEICRFLQETPSMEGQHFWCACFLADTLRARRVYVLLDRYIVSPLCSPASSPMHCESVMFTCFITYTL